jgi:5'(3')-deoxyribonucleotidase
MKKPVIAVDLDEVVVETAQNVLDHYNLTYSTNITLDQYYSTNVKETWHAPDRATAIKRVNAYLETEEYFNLPPVKEAIDAIRKLKRRYELHILTGRPDFTEAATRKWLSRYFPDIFKSVTFTNFYFGKKLSKADICKQLGAQVLIDDHLEHALGAAASGIKILLFGTYPWNKKVNLPPNITRVKNWQEVAEYFGV